MSQHQTDTVRSILGGSAIMFASQLFIVASGFLAQRFILSGLTKAENGVLFAERKLVEFLMIIAVDLGLNIVAMRRVAHRPHEQGQILSSIMAIRLTVLVPIILISLLVGSGMGYSVYDIAVLGVYSIISSKFGMWRALMDVPFRNKSRVGIPASFAILDALLFIVGIVLFRNNLTTSVVITCGFVGALPGFLFMLWANGTEVFGFRHVRMSEIKSLLRETLPLMAMIVLNAVHDKIDAIMLSAWCSTAEIGVFGAAYVSLAPITTTLPVAITFVVLPYIAREYGANPEKSGKYVFAVIRLLALIAITASSMFSVLAPDIIQIVSNGRYADNVLQFSMFLWMPLPISIIAFSLEAIVAVGKGKGAILIGMALALSTVIAGVILIPLYASVGATVAKMISVTAGCITALALLWTVVGASNGRSFISSSIVTLIVGVCGFIWLPDAVGRHVAAFLNPLLVLLAAFLSGLAKKRDIELIVSAVRNRNSAGSV